MSTTSWTFGEEPPSSSPDAAVCHLRVQILRARIDPRAANAPASHGRVRQPELYATCSVANHTKRTRAVADSSRPEWLESWCFPMTVQDLRGDVVIEVFDNGMYGACDRLDFLGRAVIPVSSSLPQSEDRGPVTIQERLVAGGSDTVDLQLELILPRQVLVIQDEASDDVAEVSAETSDDAPLLHHRDGWNGSHGMDEEECNVEVGSLFSVMPSWTRSPMLASLGLSVKVTSASPSPGVSSLCCSRAWLR